MTKTEAFEIFKFCSCPGVFNLDEQSVKLLKGWHVVVDKDSFRSAEMPLFWDGTRDGWKEEYGSGYEYEFDTYVIKDGTVFDKAKIGNTVGFFAQYYIQSWNGRIRLKEACLCNCKTFACFIMDNLDSEEKILERKSFAVSKK